jgi:hypothetical protein
MAIGLSALAVGCGDDGPRLERSSGGSSSPTPQWGQPSSGAFGGTASPTPTSTSSSVTTAPQVDPPTIDDGDGDGDGDPTVVPGVEGALILSRQRDLLDRGLINVELLNVSDVEVFFVERRLEVDGFEIEPATSKVTRLGPGRRLRVQVPYGHTVDCDSDDALTARLLVGLVDGPEASSSTPAMVELGGVDLVEQIRRRQCTARAVATAASIEIASVTDAGDRADVVIAVERIAGALPLTFVNSTGTVLVRTDSQLVDEPAALSGEEGSEVEFEVSFVVNRCDPHALAEVTKRYGLDLHVRIGDAPAEPVPVDVAEIVDLLETLVERCVRAADAG